MLAILNSDKIWIQSDVRVSIVLIKDINPLSRCTGLRLLNARAFSLDTVTR
jgi:hypothetical protein